MQQEILLDSVNSYFPMKVEEMIAIYFPNTSSLPPSPLPSRIDFQFIKTKDEFHIVFDWSRLINSYYKLQYSRIRKKVLVNSRIAMLAVSKKFFPRVMQSLWILMQCVLLDSLLFRLNAVCS